jgi:hypothetical protein
MMRPVLLLLFAFLTLAWSVPAALADEAAPELIVSVEPLELIESGGYLQGQIVIRIHLLSAFPYESLNVDIPEIDGAKTIQLLRPKNRQVETYAGTRFVFETAVALFPSQTGVLHLPVITAQGTTDNLGTKAHFEVQGPIKDVIISGADARYQDPWWLVAESVEISESWSKPLEDLRAGDTVRRDIQLIARGTTTAHLPILEHGRTQGVTTTQLERTATDQTTIDGVVATLNQSWLLKFQPQDVSYIAPLGIAYWDPRERARKKAAVPGHRLELLPADSAGIAERLMDEALQDSRRFWKWMAIVLTLALIPVLTLVVATVWAVLPSRADWRLARVLRRYGDGGITPEDSYRDMVVWADSSGINLDGLAATPNSPNVLTAYQRSVFGPGQGKDISAQDMADLRRFARLHRVERLFKRLRAIREWLRPI